MRHDYLGLPPSAARLTFLLQRVDKALARVYLRDMTQTRYFATESNPAHFHILSDGHAACRRNILPRIMRDTVESMDAEQLAQLSSYGVTVTVCPKCQSR